MACLLFFSELTDKQRGHLELMADETSKIHSLMKKGWSVNAAQVLATQMPPVSKEELLAKAQNNLIFISLKETTEDERLCLLNVLENGDFAPELDSRLYLRALAYSYDDGAPALSYLPKNVLTKPQLQKLGLHS